MPSKILPYPVTKGKMVTFAQAYCTKYLMGEITLRKNKDLCTEKQ